ncbi:MAG TPA: sulfite exporter TauE/SafE family protein [Candidatus Binatia bacterium]|nr:sulfite exporter TauE/SafE family protein [Candidatus Binatia bacterium]
MEYLLCFAGGVAGSLHCLGMCGGFPLALAQRGAAGAGFRARRWSPGDGRVAVQALYNLGRLNTLVFIGALSGALGAGVVTIGPVRGVERGLAIVAGALMMVIGLEMLGVLARFSARGSALVQRALAGLLSGVIRSPSPLAPLALGVFNAFLPCQLIYAFAARAAATASPVSGAATMLAFGLGTFPAMMGLGLTRSLAAPAVRARLSRWSAVLILGFGVLTALRGAIDVDSAHRLLHATSHVQ